MVDVAQPKLQLKWSRYIPHKPTPKQVASLLLPHREAFFGGAAGGGKSDALLMQALQYVDVPGYSAIIFRKSLTELKGSGGLLSRSLEWLGNTDAKYVASEHSWYFPTRNPDGSEGTPSRLEFGYIGDAGVYQKYQGREYQFCVEPSTPVLMGDRTWKPIKDIQVGDSVFTLQGNKRVTKTHQTKKKCVRVSTPYGSQIQSVTHRLLTSPYPSDVDISNISHVPALPSLRTCWLSHNQMRDPGSRNLDRQHVPLPSPEHAWGRLGIAVSEADNRTDCIKPFGTPLETLRHHPSSVLQERFLPLSQLNRLCYEARGTAYDPSELLKLDYPNSYWSYPHQCDGSQTDEEFYIPSHLKKLIYAGEQTPVCLLYSVSDSIRGCTPGESFSYDHPYNWSMVYSDVFSPSPATFESLDGLRDVCDITVEDSSHYITMGGFVNSNCGWDEATHQSKYDYLYMFSRLRKCICPKHIDRDDKGSPKYDPDCPICKTVQLVPLRVRAASNPGSSGHAWIKERFLILPEKDIAECQRLGIRVKYVGKHPDRPYIPSFVHDNPYLDQESYLKGLDELDPITREQLKHGDWGINPDSRFKVDWARYYSQRGEYFILGRDGIGEAIHHKQLIKLFFTVDPAASSREGPAAEVISPEDEPSWSVISVWGLTPNYHLLWLDMIRFRKEIPDVVEEIRRAYRMWRPQYIKIEDNGPGKGVYQYALKTGLPVQPNSKIRDKVSNSTDAQIRMKQGRIWLPQTAHWRDAVEGEVFSWTGSPQETDDIVDTLSDAARDVSWEACAVEQADDSDALEGDWGAPSVIPMSMGGSGYGGY